MVFLPLLQDFGGALYVAGTSNTPASLTIHSTVTFGGTGSNDGNQASSVRRGFITLLEGDQMGVSCETDKGGG